MMYSCPPTSGIRGRLRIETLASPPPCSGSHPSVLSSRVITCARTFTRESLQARKGRKEKKGRRENWVIVDVIIGMTGVNETYSSYSSVMILWEISELKWSRWHEIHHVYELETSRRASMWTSVRVSLWVTFSLCFTCDEAGSLWISLLVSSTTTMKIKNIDFFSPFLHSSF